MRPNTFVLLFLCLGPVAHLPGQGLIDSLSSGSPTQSHWSDRFSVSSYGVINYNQYDWQLLPSKRADIDFERAVLEMAYRPVSKWSFELELEIEGGGTGVAVEFDPLEEFGEFEYEVEKGGEIFLEQFNFNYKPLDQFHLSFGRLKVPFGLIGFIDEPTEYHTTNISEMENTLLPTHWTEYGVLASGLIADHFQYYCGVVSGLDGSAFSSANFIKRGNQRRFETVNVEDIAVVGRFDYVFGYEKFIGISGYVGNTRNNRPKPDLVVDAYLAMAEVHAVYEITPFEFSGIVMYGQLQNSESVSNANRNLSNNLNVKRTPVGKSALGYSAEVAFEPFELLKNHPDSELYLFARYDYFDSQHSTQGLIFNNPRWERRVVTGGINFQPMNWLVFKAQMARQWLGIKENRIQDTYSVGMGYYLR